MVGYLKIFGYLWLGKYIFLTQNIFSSAPTLGINSDRSLTTTYNQAFFVFVFQLKIFELTLTFYQLLS